MAELVTMPKLGFDMQEGTLIRWVKQIGDQVNEGDVLAEIETDKATVEVEAYASGILRKTFVKEDTVVEVGAPIAIIGGADEDISNMDTETAEEELPKAESSAEAADGQEKEVATKTAEKTEVKSEAPRGTIQPSANGDGLPDGVKASPVARRMAADQGIKLEQVKGSGPGGRIVKRDVEGFSPDEAPAAPAAVAAAKPGKVSAPTHKAPTGADIEELELSRMRQLVGERTQESFMFVPHFYVTSEIDMGPALKLRKDLNAQLSDEEKITVNDIIIKAVAITLRDFPNLNTHFYGDKLVRHKKINIGIAVAVENGLINVVAPNADKRSLSDLSVSNKAMIARAREGRIKPDDVEGATFTVSNLGAFDVEHFLAIINPPESAILAVGSAQEVPVVKDGEITIGVRMKATISVDHRVSDGAEGAQFMKRLKEVLENPMRIVV
ncbi:MAG: 2-oxo acid dehydrogenase subunit E2 [Chloroflexi bacterium]|nr:2-oxo acid dehydrogenase subunit E2 [Chloroflexota bacterium]